MLFERLLIYTFIITALYDVILRFMSLNYEKLPKFFKQHRYRFIRYLTPYFKNHTLLGAALIAGFVGFGAQFIILKLQSFPNTKQINLKELTTFMIITFIVSALYGIPMKATKLFPHLDNTYYKKLGTYSGMIHDGFSGLVVQITLFALLYLKIFK
tara:strand:+ start:56 stop:523 length:468 start_codon:yes stop_codon:yes gene_type:complete